MIWVTISYVVIIATGYLNFVIIILEEFNYFLNASICDKNAREHLFLRIRSSK